MVRVVQGNSYIDFKRCTHSCDTYSLQLVAIARHQKSFRTSDGSKVKLMKCKSKVCSENILSPNSGSKVMDSIVLCQKKMNLACCLISEQFRCLNVAVCDVYFSEGCQSCVFLLALMRDVHFIFIRFLSGNLLYFDKIVRDFVRGNLQSNITNP